MSTRTFICVAFLQYYNLARACCRRRRMLNLCAHTNVPQFQSCYIKSSNIYFFCDNLHQIRALLFYCATMTNNECFSALEEEKKTFIHPCTLLNPSPFATYTHDPAFDRRCNAAVRPPSHRSLYRSY